MTAPRHREIRLFVTDVDGTLTDGGMYYTADGELMKRFNTRDGMGMRLLREAGLQLAIITSEESEIVLRRAEKLKISHVYVGIRDKLARVSELCTSLRLRLDQVAYVGDDLNDLDLIKKVGLSFAPADAAAEVLECVHVKLSRRGGDGAVREAAEWLLKYIPEIPCDERDRPAKKGG